jgi:diguanylate cyclase (GGDEF)-like protein
MRRIAMLAVPAGALAIATGILNAQLDWNGLQVPLGPAWLDVTLYPPLLISVLAALWLGPAWGIIPAYLANLVSAAWSGIPWTTSALFAFAGAVETAIVWGSMVTLNISPDLRRPSDVVGFVSASIIAPVVSSLAVLIWNTALGLDFVEGQRVWRGWMLGDFVQLVLVAAPILHFWGPSARRWIDRQFAVPPHQDPSHVRSAAFASVVFTLLGVLVIVGSVMLSASMGVGPDTRTVQGELLEPRLRELQLFQTLLVVALIVATATFSTGLARMGERQRARATRDTLTGCLNRRAFFERFYIEADRSRRLGKGLSVLFVDVDYFKSVNDRYGHDAGDLLLKEIAACFQGAIRETDLLFRWGGEEFVVLLAHTGLEDATALAERLRTRVASTAFLASGGKSPVRLTISVGIAAAEAEEDPDTVVNRADAACYRVKHHGRDAIAVAG